MYCAKCGAELNEGVKFCGKCGAAIQKNESRSTQSNATNSNEKASGFLTIAKERASNYYEKAKNFVSDSETKEKAVKIMDGCMEKNYNAWKYLIYKVPAVANPIKSKLETKNSAYKSRLALCASAAIIVLLFCFTPLRKLTPFGTNLQKEFNASLPNTPYSVKIYYETISNGWAFVTTETSNPENANSQSSRERMIWFNPKTKSTGTATVERWKINREGWLDAYTAIYQYEIKDNVIYLFNGTSVYNRRRADIGGSPKTDDRRFKIEKCKEGGVQLRGVIEDKERILTPIPDHGQNVKRHLYEL